MGEIIVTIIGCLLVSNIIFSQFLGMCPFLGISKKPSNAIGMGCALTFVVAFSSIIFPGRMKQRFHRRPGRFQPETPGLRSFPGIPRRPEYPSFPSGTKPNKRLQVLDRFV